MENKLNYPIKYAVLELKEQGGWSTNYEDVTVGFIVSKCYVVEQNTRYLQNGTSKTSYKVVFPYKDFNNYKYRLLRGIDINEHEHVPEYNYYRECTNANTVSDVFDTYEEATEIANQENHNKKRSIICKIVKYDSILKEFEENLAICKSYEQIILEKTTEMTITNENVTVKKLTRKQTDK